MDDARHHSSAPHGACEDPPPVRIGRPRSELQSERGRGPAEPCLRLRHEGAWRSEAGLGRSVFLPPPRSRGDPDRSQARRRHHRRRRPARHDRRHGSHPRGDRPALRRRDRQPRRRPDQDQAARPRVETGRAGREPAQAAPRHRGRHQGAAGQAGRPAAQHADLALRPGRQAGADRAGDARHLCAPLRPDGHAEHAQRTRGTGLPGPDAGGARHDRVPSRRHDGPLRLADRQDRDRTGREAGSSAASRPT